MKKNYYLSLFAILLFITNSIAQNVGVTDNSYRVSDAYSKLKSRIDNKPDIDVNKVTGSKYFIETYMPGKIFVNDKQYKNQIFPLRYNAYEDIIEINNEKNEIDALSLNKEIYCTINGEKYVYKDYKLKKKGNKLGYLKVIGESDNLIVYVKQLAKYKEAKVAKTPHSKSFPAKFVKSEVFYFASDPSQTASILTKKSLLGSLTKDKASKLKTYLRKNNIDFKKGRDLKKVVNYYKTL